MLIITIVEWEGLFFFFFFSIGGKKEVTTGQSLRDRSLCMSQYFVGNGEQFHNRMVICLTDHFGTASILRVRNQSSKMKKKSFCGNWLRVNLPQNWMIRIYFLLLFAPHLPAHSLAPHFIYKETVAILIASVVYSYAYTRTASHGEFFFSQFYVPGFLKKKRQFGLGQFKTMKTGTKIWQEFATREFISTPKLVKRAVTLVSHRDNCFQAPKNTAH